MSTGYIGLEGSPATIRINYPAFDIEDLDFATEGLAGAEGLTVTDKDRIIRRTAEALESGGYLADRIDAIMCDEALDQAERYLSEKRA